MHRSTLIISGFACLAACSAQAGENQGDTTSNAQVSTVEAGQQIVSEGPASGCTASLAFDETTGSDLPDTLRPGGSDLQRLDAAIDEAVQSACAEGLITAEGFQNDGRRLEAFLVRNAPEANVASVFADDSHAVLEAPLFRSGAEVSVPSAADIKEAIYCFARGPTQAEVETDGRCLPD